MPVTRNSRASLGEHNAQIATSESLAQSREVRQAAMGSPYSPILSKFKGGPAAGAAAPSTSRGQFGSVLPNGLPGGLRGRFSRTESMPVIASSSHLSDSEDPTASPVSTRTRTASTKQGLAPSAISEVDQLSNQEATSSSSSSQRRTGTVKRSEAAAASSNGPSPNTCGQSGNSSSAADPRPGEGGGGDNDEDDDEDESRRRPRRSSRLGGCSSQSEQLHERDDSNKENVAPLNYAYNSGSSELEVVIPSSARLSSRMGTMARRSASSPNVNFHGMASHSSVPGSVNPRRSPRRSGPTRIDSFNSNRRPSPMAVSSAAPSTPSRRIRGALNPAIIEAGIPASPFARLNLAAAGPSSVFGRSTSLSNRTSLADDAESSYFSSQGSGSVAPSIFDATSQVADEDSDMDDLSIIPGPQGDLAGPRQSSEVVPEKHSAADDLKTNVESGDGAAHDVEMQDVDATLVEPVVVDVSRPKKQRFPNVYAHARALLRFSSSTGAGRQATTPSTTSSKREGGNDDGEDARENGFEIVGRERERAMIKTFLTARFGDEALFASARSSDVEHASIQLDTNAPSLYMCGLPGTGKTALVRSILSELRQQDATTMTARVVPAPRIAFVNCMSITAPRLIFGKILEQLGEPVPLKACDGLSSEAEGALEMALKKSDRHVLIVLDEIDHLLEKRAHQSVLQRLFCIGKSKAALSNKSAKCAMIGIANSLDLTERFMPLLAHTGMAPAMLHMQPFIAEDIVKVVRSRLAGLHARYDLGPEEESEPAQNTADAIFKKPALELASKRIAAATGDLRKALDVCRLAVESVEAEQRQGAMYVMTTESTAGQVIAAELLAPLTPETAPRVMPQHVVKVLNSVLGSAQIGRVRGLDVHAKFFLLAYLVAERRLAEGLPVLGSGGGADDKAALASAAAATTTSGGGSSKSKKAMSSGGLRFMDVERTYATLLKNDAGGLSAHFAGVTTSELLQVVENLEVVGVVTLSNEAGSGSSGGGVGRAGKKAAGGGGGATGRVVSLVLAQEDVREGITTAAAASFSSSSSEGGNSSNGAIAVVADAISRMWYKEETRIVRSRGWEAAAVQSEAVRRAELGGGRGFQPVGL
ncbi:unnamed protein product [Tilletia caries]|uniref:AAA+ ATPase domain-containing protein n=3 Tax=Tilletia TaxID=13289 RepID=A0A8T8T5V8_9BASI|nr:hypothetical protein CF336_g7354 [Tilletia laevis]KAE8200361.1 hypothetical protein CF328_g2991 [Tilletia controversa]KAE8256262.1 hypothetical protein A4X03_0g5442 [Tilletia caries]CAD6884516.1 unnamed protein product [Tilletia caries]CAD6903925.1 unnamed protein product [Tilletia caries]